MSRSAFLLKYGPFRENIQAHQRALNLSATPEQVHRIIDDNDDTANVNLIRRNPTVLNDEHIKRLLETPYKPSVMGSLKLPSEYYSSDHPDFHENQKRLVSNPHTPTHLLDTILENNKSDSFIHNEISFHPNASKNALSYIRDEGAGFPQHRAFNRLLKKDYK